MAENTPIIDLEKIKAEANQAVSKMSREELIASFEKIRVRNKVQQKKQQGKGSQKAYMKKKLEQEKLIKARIAELGLTEELDAKADAEAEVKFKEWVESQAEETETEEEEVA